MSAKDRTFTGIIPEIVPEMIAYQKVCKVPPGHAWVNGPRSRSQDNISKSMQSALKSRYFEIDFRLNLFY